MDHLPQLKESEPNPACRETSLLYTQTGRQPDDVICTNSRRSDCGKHEEHPGLPPWETEPQLRGFGWFYRSVDQQEINLGLQETIIFCLWVVVCSI